MRNYNSTPGRRTAAGFTLPAILVVVSALLILAVGILLMVGIERNTARSFVDRERAELAARAGLEDVKGIFNKDAANDDFLIMQSALSPAEVTSFIQSEDVDKPTDEKKDSIPYLYLARGSEKGYRYTPIFSTENLPDSKDADSGSTPDMKPETPKIMDLLGSDAVSSNGKAYAKFQTLPYHNDVRASWIPIKAEKDKAGNEKIVSRYAYWVEDLQSRVDAGTAGNTEDGGAHKRYGWKAGDTSNLAKFPAPGLNAKPSKLDTDGKETEPSLNQVALFALDPATGAKDDSNLDKTIIDGRKFLVSPNSTLAIAGIEPPLARDADSGRLTDKKARAVEESLAASIQPYDEQPLVPYSTGIASSVMGKPKLNLNALLAEPPATAVDEMAGWIRKSLPDFDKRKGGFPATQDYLQTLAANAIGYAAKGNAPVVKLGTYRGLGASPLLSEIVMDVNYLGSSTKNGSKIMIYQFILFAEMVNHTNLPITGNAALSYEIGYTLPGLGAAPTGGSRFDDKSLLEDKSQCNHDLSNWDGGYYWSAPQSVSLAPGEYKFYKFATVNYLINIGSPSAGVNFALSEPLGAAGVSMKWNNKPVDRIPSIVRDSLSFNANYRRYFGKAAVPGHSYGPYGLFINNMGDPRSAHYISGIALGENLFPENISPGRRNIRYKTIYSTDSTAGKLKTFGRVLPSEWPDGGHDSEVTTWDPGWSVAREGTVSTNPPVSGTGPAFDPTPPTPSKATGIPAGPIPQVGEAITYFSDRGRYYSATELGRLFDPIMYLPTFDPASGLDSNVLRSDGSPGPNAGLMPAAGAAWPLVQINNKTSQSFCGGNTLRIGRPEHPMFNQNASHTVDHVPSDMPGTHAARLLDIFHAGKSRSDEQSDREGALVRIEGNVNVNTATRDTLRAMAAGYLTMDPKLSTRPSVTAFDGRMAPAIQSLSTLSAPSLDSEADVVADAIIKGRPYTSPSELACARDADGKQVFGNPTLYKENDKDKNKIQWSDAAAEEVFGRVYEASTVRSRNFRVWVVGQSLSPTTAGNPSPEVLSEVRKVYTVFASPGERKNTGEIDPTKFRVKVINENDF
jgi:type II secretory pathway pseudopilin PulG